MTIVTVTQRVFIASPGDLDVERDYVKHVISNYNITDANPRGFHFACVGWEDCPGGPGIPQDQIDALLDACDLAFVILGERWGSPPRPGGPHESGTHAEFERIEKARQDACRPMSDLLILFKGIKPESQVDPDAQLKAVLAFRQALDRNKTHFYRTFDTIDELGDRIRAKLASWLLNSERQAHGLRIMGEQPPVTEVKAAGDIGATIGPLYESSENIENAMRLAQEGHLGEAEVLFATAVVRTPDVLAFDAYCAFLLGSGRRAVAEVMRAESARLAAVAGNAIFECVAIWRRGMICEQAGELAASRGAYQEALVLAQSKQLRELQPGLLGAVGNAMLLSGDYEAAERYFNAARETCVAGRDDGTRANVYLSLSAINYYRDNSNEAESLAREALRIARASSVRSTELAALLAVGNILQGRSDPLMAEAFYTEALAIAREVGKLEAILKSRMNLALLLLRRGDAENAILAIAGVKAEAETAGLLEVVMSTSQYLGVASGVQGRWDEAEKYARECLEVAVAAGFRQEAAVAMTNLGTSLREQGKSGEARECYDRAVKEYMSMGLVSRAERVQEFIGRIPEDGK